MAVVFGMIFLCCVGTVTAGYVVHKALAAFGAAQKEQLALVKHFGDLVKAKSLEESSIVEQQRAYHDAGMRLMEDELAASFEREKAERNKEDVEKIRTADGQVHDIDDLIFVD